MKKVDRIQLPIMFAIAVAIMTFGTVQTGYSSGKHAKLTKHYEDTLFKVTDNGKFGVEVILPDEGVEMGINKVDLIVHDAKDRDVADAKISVTPWMPRMNHGVSAAPIVSERGGGLYAVANVEFNMTGMWDLRIEISKGRVTDRTVITLPEIGTMGHMRATQAPDTSKINTATEKKTRNDRFIVSYESDPSPIPVNRLLTWTLHIKTPDGRPVTGAKMLIVGDMPEHGHGFPTVPEVTEEFAGGKYIVEGIKFSMPGWWVVDFHILAGGVMDHVGFNLVIK